MVNISTFGDSAIKFTFTDSDHYLYGDGEITVPVNSLLLVVDESDMVTFKKPDGDSFISFNISNSNFASKAELEAFYKENMTGGGGGSIDSGAVQTMIDASISGMADNASYDSVSQEIKFYNGNTEVYSVDASAFVIDGMIDDVRIETISGVTYLVIDFNTASGKEDIQIPLTDIFDPSNYYTKQEVDASLSGKQDTLIEGIGINIDDNVISVENPSVYLTQAEYDALVSGGTVDPDTYYVISDATAIDINQYYTSAQTNSAINAAVSGKADASAVYTKTEVDNAISAATDDMATKTWVGEQGYLTEHQSLSAYSTTDEVNIAINEATSGKADTSAVTESINAAVSGKADTSYVQASRLKSMSGGSLDLSDYPSYIKNIDVKGGSLKATLSYQGNGDYWTIYDKDVLRFGDGLLYKNGALSADERIIDSYSTEHSYCYELSAITTESYVNLSDSSFVGVKFDGVQNFFMADFTLYADSAQTNERISISYRRNDGAMEGDLNILVFDYNGELVYNKTSTVYSQATNNIIIPFDFEDLGFNTPSWLYVDSMVKNSITSICGVDRIKYTSVKDFVKELDSEIDTKVETSAITSAVTSASTDNEIPTAKAVYDSLSNVSIEVSSAITSGDTNAVAGGAVYDAFENFEGFNPIADTVTLEMGSYNHGRNDSGVGYGVLNYNTFNPITNTTTSGNTADVFKFSVIDFKGENNILKFNGSAIDSNKLKSRSPFVSLTSFTDGYSASTNQATIMFDYDTCLVLATNAEFTGFMYDNVSINISGPNGKSGSISFEGEMGQNSIDIYVNYNGHSIKRTISPLVLGSSYIIDLRDAGWGDEGGIHTLTVSNWDSDTFISSMKFYKAGNATTPISDIASDVAAGVYATTAEMFDELSHVAKKEEVNFYEYGSPSAVTITGWAQITDFYGIVISGMSGSFNINVKTDDASGNYVDTLGFYLDGSISSEKFPHEPIPYYLDDELTKFDNGVWNIYFAEGTKVNYLSMNTTTVASAVIYKSLTETPIKDAISGKVDTSSVVTAVTSGSTDSEIPTAKAVFDAIPTGGGKTISAGTNISVTTGETADTVSCTLPIIGNGRGSLNGFTLVSNGANNYVDGQTSYATVLGSNNVAQNRRQSIFVCGDNNVSTLDYGFACGRYNQENVAASTTFGNSGNTLFSVGNGTSWNARHNAFEIRQNGDIYISSGGTDIKLQDNLGGGSVSSAVTSGDTNAVSSDAVYTAMGGLKLQQITQADYEALVSGGTVDNSTLYIITNVVS